LYSLTNKQLWPAVRFLVFALGLLECLKALLVKKNLAVLSAEALLHYKIACQLVHISPCRKVQGEGEEVNLEKEFRKKFDSAGEIITLYTVWRT
jgi:hypothetical protein